MGVVERIFYERAGMGTLSKIIIFTKRTLGLIPLVKRYPQADVRGSAFIEFEENVVLHGRVYIGPDAYWSAKGGIEIGDNVLFGPKTIIWTYNHEYEKGDLIPYGSPKYDRLQKVVIESNVWIGLGATIMPGVRVGEGAVVAAGSVVTKDVPPMTVVAGNPAKIVKERDRDRYQELKQSSALYLYARNSE